MSARVSTKIASQLGIKGADFRQGIGSRLSGETAPRLAVEPAPHVTIVFPGQPVAFARARSNGTRRFTAEKQASFAQQLGLVARRAMGGRPPFQGAVQVWCSFSYIAPASRQNEVWKTSKPDVDNLAKLCADALSGIVWADDATIVSLTAEKIFAAEERVTLVVYPLVNSKAP